MVNNGLSGLHDLSDNELVELAQKGDSNAYSVLVGRYIFLVRNCASGYFSDSLDFDDLMQEGFIGLMNAVRFFDCGCNAKFSTFAKLCVDRNIISAVRKSLRKKQIPKSMMIFIDDNESDGVVTAVTADEPETAVIDKEDYIRLRESIANKLSKTEFNVLLAYLTGQSYESIAEKLGISQKSVDNAMQRVRSKLR